MARYLLDSDVLIWLLRGRAETVKRLEELEGPFGTSAVSRAEIWAGARESEHRKIAELFQNLTTFPVDGPVADVAGQFLREHRKAGHLELADALIAATAAVHGLFLVTYNTSHFPMPDVKLV